jgi:iron complex outermembrane recepter protein
MQARRSGLRAAVRTAAPLLAAMSAAFPRTATADHPLPPVIISETPSIAEKNKLPVQTESITAPEIADKVNLINTEDAIKYLPGILVRKRHVGDTQAPITTRTSGVGASARGLIYADGVLLSALIGNNNSAASPKWGMVSPQEIERIDVMYGPFAASYPGNSIGAVVEMTTRMPRKFEGSAALTGSTQRFEQYGTNDTYNAYQASALLGNRTGPWSWWLSVNHLDSKQQPLAYVTVTRPVAPAAGGTPVTGAFADFNRNGAPIYVVGAGGIERHLQDNFKLKVAYDFTPTVRATYSVGLFENDARGRVETYLRDASGSPVYAGTANVDGFPVTLTPSAFSNNYYNLDEKHWMQSLTLRTNTRGTWDFEAVASVYRYADNVQRTPTGALPDAAFGGAGRILVLDGTGWSNVDLKAVWRPFGYSGPHHVSFGAHHDRYKLKQPTFNTSNWMTGGKEALAAESRGTTETRAVWAQDVWSFARNWRATFGGRYEWWRAYDGLNFAPAALPLPLVDQPTLSANRFSPKASVAWTPTDTLLLTASLARAYRFPTVTELYQAVTSGADTRVPNPNLRPERAWSAELSAEHALKAGRVRISLFQEQITDALISQSGTIAPGTGIFTFAQNIDRVRSRGVELVGQSDNVLVHGLELAGSVTYVDSRIRADAAFPAAVGKRTPQVPDWRATLVATYRPSERAAMTLAARYGARVWGTAENTDVYPHTFQGFESYFVVDARLRYRFDKGWSAALGVENLNNRKYFLFHPFPQRTVVAELRYDH